MKKFKAKKKVISKIEDEGKTDKSSDKPSPSKQADVPDELETEKTIRKSTRTSVIVRQAEREAIRAEKEATAKVYIFHTEALHFLHQMLFVLIQQNIVSLRLVCRPMVF